MWIACYELPIFLNSFFDDVANYFLSLHFSIPLKH